MVTKDVVEIQPVNDSSVTPMHSQMPRSTRTPFLATSVLVARHNQVPLMHWRCFMVPHEPKAAPDQAVCSNFGDVPSTGHQLCEHISMAQC